MRKFVLGGVAAGLVAATIGVYLATHPHPAEQALPSLEEEQEAPSPVSFSIGEFVQQAPSVAYPQEVVEANEPILVEGPVIEQPAVTEIGGEPVPGVGANFAAGAVPQPPRPDEEPGQERKMPYADATDPAETLEPPEQSHSLLSPTRIDLSSRS